MNPAAKQKFSKLQFSIITGMHLLAIGGLFFYSIQACLVWVVAHVFFGMVGASLGLHRLFSHRSFEAHPVLEKIIAVTATLCFQGGPIFWAAAHRIHHKMSEKNGDPYNAQKGFFWSHIGWLFYKNPNGFDYALNLKNVSDLRKNKFITWLELNSTSLNFTFLVSLFLMSFYFNRMDLFFWLGPIRVVSVWHATWLINSYAHKASLFSEKPLVLYRNSILMCFLIGGDGFHDYHHKYPATAKHAPGKFHLDFGFYLLKILSLVNLVKIKKTEYESAEEYKIAL